MHGREPAEPACAPSAERAWPRTSEEPTRHARAGEAGTSRAQTPVGSGRGSEGLQGEEARAPRVESSGVPAPIVGFQRQPGIPGSEGSPVGLSFLQEIRANVDKNWRGGEYNGLGSNPIRPNPSTAKAISLDLAQPGPPNALLGKG